MDRIAILQEVHRVLKDQGVFALLVWNEALLLKYSIILSRIIAKFKGIKLPIDFMCVAFDFETIRDEIHKAGFKIEERINTASLYGVLDSVRYLKMKKYQRTFGKSERESGTIHPQNILKDLQQMSSSDSLTKIFYKIAKYFPDLFALYSIFILSKS